MQLQPGLANLLVPAPRLGPADLPLVQCLIPTRRPRSGGRSGGAGEKHEQAGQALPHALPGRVCWVLQLQCTALSSLLSTYSRRKLLLAWADAALGKVYNSP